MKCATLFYIVLFTKVVLREMVYSQQSVYNKKKQVTTNILTEIMWRALNSLWQVTTTILTLEKLQ